MIKGKKLNKLYIPGLNFEEFEEALLRIAIKHKTVFNKISEKIKENVMSEKEIKSIIQKDIEEKAKSEVDEMDEINIKSLLVEEDVNKEILDDYGDINKVTPQTLKGLVFYLKVPAEKKGQEERFR